MTAAEYAKPTLFEPLGITDFYWPTDATGYTRGWGDLALHPRDAAKIGFFSCIRDNGKAVRSFRGNG